MKHLRFRAAILTFLVGASLWAGLGLCSLVLTGWTHGAPTYTGLVGTRARTSNFLFSSGTAAMIRTGHYARTNITSLKVMFANFYMNSTGNEIGPGSATTITASVEYPAGVCTAFTFSSSPSGSMPDGGTITTDSATISIPSGAQFWLRRYVPNANGVIVSNPASVRDTTNLGDAIEVISTDKTVTCTSLSTSNLGIPFPLAIIGPTSAPSVCMVGDSIAWGGGSDTYTDTSGNMGLLERSVGPVFAYANVSAGSDEAFYFVSNHTQRSKVFPFCTSFIVEYGRNDFYVGGFTVAQLQANLTTIYGYFTGAKAIIQTTLTPDTTSSDSWATTVNQTLGSAETNMATFNSNLRASTFGPAGGYYDARSVLGTSTNFGLWLVNGSPNYCTTDGVHPTPACYTIVQSSGIINTGRLQ